MTNEGVVKITVILAFEPGSSVFPVHFDFKSHKLRATVQKKHDEGLPVISMFTSHHAKIHQMNAKPQTHVIQTL